MSRMRFSARACRTEERVLSRFGHRDRSGGVVLRYHSLFYFGASQKEGAAPPPLPTFFPPKATATVELPVKQSSGTLTLAHLSDRISKAMDEAGYEHRSYFWLDKEHAPGFAIITHIEQIHADGTPVTTRRWSFDLPSYEHFSIASFLKAMIKADPGNYRMIALVVSQVAFEEKNQSLRTK